MTGPAPKDAPLGSLAEPRITPVTLRTLNRMAQRAEPFSCLACYDALTASLLERAGVHVLLLGDSAAQIVLGHPRTVDMPLELSILMTAALKRGAPNTVCMADMPFMSYQADDAEGVRNAGRYITEGQADIVKIEADASYAPLVQKMTRAGVPVCGHVGLLPQHAGMVGAYIAAGRTAAHAQKVIDDAVALEDAGCVMLLIEAVPDEVTQRILERTSVPVIGIGAGTACHGQILVAPDLLGMTTQTPRFVEPTANLGDEIVRAVSTWVGRVSAREIGGERYKMAPQEAQRLESHSDRPSENPKTDAERAAR